MISGAYSDAAINDINRSQETLTDSSIPALVDVNHLSAISDNIIQESLLMSSANNFAQLDRRMNKSTKSINFLLDSLEIIKEYDLSNNLIIEIKDILKSQKIDIDELYKKITKKIEY